MRTNPPLEPSDRETARTGSRWSRRTILASIAGSVPALVAGCLADDDADEPVPEPVSLDGSKQCDYCSMIIENHPGTNAQLFYRDDRPDDRDGPAWFCALHCAHNFHADRDRLGWDLIVRYATDYSTVDYEIEVINDTQYISTHVGRETFADADDLLFVVGTGIEGAMGAEYVPFSSSDDADAFAAEYGGDVFDWESFETDVLAAE